MNRLVLHFTIELALIFGVFVPTEKAVAQTTQEIVGTWTLVSIQLEKDGKRTDMYGPNPQGQQIFDTHGRFSLIITRSDVPKFASNNREAGTPEENKAAVQGSIAFFGTYTVDESAKTLTQHVESCSFPNFNGTDRKLSFSISGDELNSTTISKASTGTGSAYLVWKRVQ
jgi:Lipocalin-like domain